MWNSTVIVSPPMERLGKQCRENGSGEERLGMEKIVAGIN
jgi:hypothetical protein